MILRLFDRIHKWERRLHNQSGRDISTPAARREARRHYLWFDHGILRVLWTNFDQIAPGVYRSNQPDPKRLERYAKLGIKTILNLRGATPYSPYLFEKEACERLGIRLVDLELHARKAPRPEALLELIDLFPKLEKPFLIHCKSGADRAGLASALYLLTQEDVPIATAKRQLSLRYVHVKASRTGILDHVLDLYEARLAEGPIPFRDWVAKEYDPEAAIRSFEGKGRKDA